MHWKKKVWIEKVRNWWSEKVKLKTFCYIVMQKLFVKVLLSNASVHILCYLHERKQKYLPLSSLTFACYFPQRTCILKHWIVSSRLRLFVLPFLFLSRIFPWISTDLEFGISCFLSQMFFHHQNKKCCLLRIKFTPIWQ